MRVAGGVTPTWTVTLPQMPLTQLVFGYRGVVEDITQEEDVTIPADLLPLLDTPLFPVGSPWMAIPDWF